MEFEQVSESKKLVEVFLLELVCQKTFLLGAISFDQHQVKLFILEQLTWLEELT
tara:strand:- start:940 stop:1101 length:162 start_codon:yes stop_codon:yes gene_type:complete